MAAILALALMLRPGYRKEFATDIERNAVHGSDAPETAKEEIAFFFSTAELAALSR